MSGEHVIHDGDVVYRADARERCTELLIEWREPGTASWPWHLVPTAVHLFGVTPHELMVSPAFTIEQSVSFDGRQRLRFKRN